MALLSAVLSLPSRSEAGDGRVHPNGDIDLTMNIRFPQTEAWLARLDAYIRKTNEILCDVTEGQFRLGQVTLEEGKIDEDLADVWVHAIPGRSYAYIGKIGSRSPGLNITLFFSSGSQFDPEPPATLAHELGHYALGLWDEYAVDGYCSQAVCIDNWRQTYQHQCIMQSLDSTELCTHAVHDLDRSTVGTCNRASKQERKKHESCWETAANNFAHASAPNHVSKGPFGYACGSPVIVNRLSVPSETMLVLDRSGSMSFGSSFSETEVCNNTVDDDGDGQTDEPECAKPRIHYVKASAKAWLSLAAEIRA